MFYLATINNMFRPGVYGCSICEVVYGSLKCKIPIWVAAVYLVIYH